MKKALVRTDFNFPGQKSVYHGKVRDVYNINDEVLVMVATDRISAFDVVLPEGIPYKGQMLNQIAAKFLDATTDICPNWKMASPDPMVTVGVQCEGFPVEMIVRGYLCGSAWRAYKSGVREICGVKLPEGMRENQRFPEPIIHLTRDYEDQVMGLQFSLWTERVADAKRLDYMTFPRLVAVAESAWTPAKSKECSLFMQKLPYFLQFLGEKGIYYFNPFNPESTPEPSAPDKDDVLKNG